MRALSVLLMLGLLLPAAPPAGAGQETGHRYTVRGYLLDAENRPMSGWTVTIGRDGERLAAATTDRDGYYSVTLELRDADLGDRLQLRAGKARASIRVRGEGGRAVSEREHWASFVGGRFVEEDVGAFRVPGWGWVLVGLVGIAALLFGVARLERFVKKRRAAAARQRSPSRRRRRGRRH